MSKGKKVVSVLIVIVLTIFFVGCSVQSNETTAEPKEKLTIGLMPAVDAIAVTIAQQNGYFEKYGVDVDLEIFKSPKDRDAAFQSGELDGISTDQVAIALYQNAGIDVKITGVVDGDFLLVAAKDSGIKSMDDIKGKTIGISEKSVIEYSLDHMLEKSSIIPDEVEKTAIPAIPARLEMLRNNKIDMALLPEPFATFAVKDGGILISRANDLGLNPAVLAFTQESIETKPAEIKAFYKAYNDAVEYLNSTPVSEYEDTIIKTVGYPEDMKGKIEQPKYSINQLPSQEELQDSINWIIEKGLLNKDLTPNDMISDIAVK